MEEGVDELDWRRGTVEEGLENAADKACLIISLDVVRAMRPTFSSTRLARAVASIIAGPARISDCTRFSMKVSATSLGIDTDAEANITSSKGDQL